MGKETKIAAVAVDMKHVGQGEWLSAWGKDRCVDIELKPVDFCVSNNPEHAAQGPSRNQASSTQRTVL